MADTHTRQKGFLLDHDAFAVCPNPLNAYDSKKCTLFVPFPS